jgi:hypothetical protein
MSSDSEPAAAAALPHAGGTGRAQAEQRGPCCGARATSARRSSARARLQSAEGHQRGSERRLRQAAEHAELKTKHTLNLELLNAALLRELDSKSSVVGELHDWFADGETNPSLP